MSNSLTLASNIKRVSITVPAAAGDALPAATLASLTSDERARLVGFEILPVISNGSTREAFVIGDSAASLLQYVPAGEGYAEPVLRDAVDSFLKAASGASFTAIAVFYLVKG